MELENEETLNRKRLAEGLTAYALFSVGDAFPCFLQFDDNSILRLQANLEKRFCQYLQANL